jgi:hypothetical protein
MHLITAVLFTAMAISSAVQEPSLTGWNKKSTLKSNRAVEFPGIILDPGTYVIRLKESTETRALVEIWNEGESQILGTVLAVPDHELRPDDDSEFIFFSAPEGKPEAVRTWFYSGEVIGWEFVYPKAHAKEIAKAADTHVMASNSNSKDDVIVAVTPNGTEVVIDAPRPAQTAREKPTQREHDSAKP